MSNTLPARAHVLSHCSDSVPAAAAQGGEIIGWQNMYTREGDFGTAVFYPDQESSAVILPECGISDCRNAFCSGALPTCRTAAGLLLPWQLSWLGLVLGWPDVCRNSSSDSLLHASGSPHPASRPGADPRERAARVWRA